MKIKEEKFDMVGLMMSFEEGTLDEENTIKLFQHLINTGIVWRLQGGYDRMAEQLINAGHCHRKE